MNLIHTTKPSKIQKAHMTNLVNTCKAAEPLSLSAPVEDDLGYDILLLYEDGEQGPLAAMSFLFFPQEGPCECCVFVDPKKRRRGHFSLLLDKTLDLVDAYEKTQKTSVDFCFLADERTPYGHWRRILVLRAPDGAAPDFKGQTVLLMFPDH